MNDTKICGKCEQELPLTPAFFHRMKSTSDGFRGTCKACRKHRDQHVQEHGVEEKVLDGTKRCCLCKERLPATNEFFHKHKKDKDYGLHNTCKSCSKAYNQQYRKDNKEKISELGKRYNAREDIKEIKSDYNKQHRKENRQKIRDQRLEFRKQNREMLAAKERKWRQENPDLYNERKRKSYHKRASKDPLFRLQKNMRRRLSLAINGQGKSASTMKLIGCSIDELRLHLENMFEGWMSWKNYGCYTRLGERTWVVDHIIPCASFDLSKPEQQRECFNYKNLQPLCSRENNIKGDRLDYPTKKGQDVTPDP